MENWRKGMEVGNSSRDLSEHKLQKLEFLI